MDLMSNFAKSCIFIHDDRAGITDLSGCDWDQYGTRPLLLGVNSCVSGKEDALGQVYREYRDRLFGMPEHHIEIETSGQPLLTALRSSTKAKEKLKQLLENKYIGISSYYSGASIAHDFSEIFPEDPTPRIFPTSEVYEIANDKITAWQLLRRNGLPVPQAEVCMSLDDLRRYVRFAEKHGNRVIVKSDHWNIHALSSTDELDKLLDLDYPVLVEPEYGVCCSVVSHNLIWNGRQQHLFTIQQVIHNFEHFGNFIPIDRDYEDAKNEVSELSSAISDLLRGLNGVIGIDYIITSEGKVLIVDLNPRLNSSTYPFEYVMGKGVDLFVKQVRYGFTRCRIQELGDLLQDKQFHHYDPQRDEGVIIFSPFFDYDQERITMLSYIIVAQDRRRCQALRKSLLHMVDRYSRL